jgi:hypothetical protein
MGSRANWLSYRDGVPVGRGEPFRIVICGRVHVKSNPSRQAGAGHQN